MSKEAIETKATTISEVLYPWLFIADSLTQTKYAVHREDYVAFCNGLECKHEVHKSKTMSLDELAEFVKQQEG
jgi:hypothetical protein